MKEYETIFVLRSTTSDKDAEDIKGRIIKLIATHKGTMLVDRAWGKRTLAYPMQKQKEGFYFQLDYAAEGGAIIEIEKILRLDERVLRLMTVVLQDDVDVVKRAEELVQIQTQQQALQDVAAQPAI